jgi:hypothetical protein
MLHAVGVNQRKKKLTIYDKIRLATLPNIRKNKDHHGSSGQIISVPLFHG